MKETLKKIRILPVISCCFLLILAYVLKFRLPGYGFSALVCCGITALIAFYEGSRLMLSQYPKPTKLLRKIVTICLIIGLLAFAVTEWTLFSRLLGGPQPALGLAVVGLFKDELSLALAPWARFRHGKVWKCWLYCLPFGRRIEDEVRYLVARLKEGEKRYGDDGERKIHADLHSLSLR